MVARRKGERRHSDPSKCFPKHGGVGNPDGETDPPLPCHTNDPYKETRSSQVFAEQTENKKRSRAQRRSFAPRGGPQGDRTQERASPVGACQPGTCSRSSGKLSWPMLGSEARPYPRCLLRHSHHPIAGSWERRLIQSSVSYPRHPCQALLHRLRRRPFHLLKIPRGTFLKPATTFTQET